MWKNAVLPILKLMRKSSVNKIPLYYIVSLYYQVECFKSLSIEHHIDEDFIILSILFSLGISPKSHNIAMFNDLVKAAMINEHIHDLSRDKTIKVTEACRIAT